MMSRWPTSLMTLAPPTLFTYAIPHLPSRTCVLLQVAASVVANRAQRHMVPECVLGCAVGFRFEGLGTFLGTWCQNACSDVHSTSRMALFQRLFLSSFSRATFSAAPRGWSEMLRAGCERAWDQMRRTAGCGRRLASGQRQQLCVGAPRVAR
jgi:hypothetical protein